MSEQQVHYIPFSSGQPLGLLVPKNLSTAIQTSLTQLINEIGVDIDTYVSDQLKISKEQLYSTLSAEQIDGVALAIDHLKKGKAFIYGDQTGVGKGLQLACIARYTLLNTNYIPIFITQAPNLYNDFYMELKRLDIDAKILITNNNTNLLFEDGTVIKTNSHHDSVLRDYAQNPDKSRYNIIFTTYSQMQSVGGRNPYRREFVYQMAPTSYLLMDESHNAGGSEQDMNLGLSKRSNFLRELVRRSAGVVFSSATYAKNPYTMTLYAEKTSVMDSFDDPIHMMNTVVNGGIPYQQVIANLLTESGEYIRRERSYAGITFNTNIVSTDLDFYNQVSSIIHELFEFENLKEDAIRNMANNFNSASDKLLYLSLILGNDAAIEFLEINEKTKVKIKTTSFSLVLNNFISNFLVALKAEESVQEAVQAIQRGEKPILYLSNTMGSFISEIQEKIKSGEISLEEEDLERYLSYGGLLERFIDNSLKIKIYVDNLEFGSRFLTEEDLGEAASQKLKSIREKIRNVEWSKIPLSSIDYMKKRLEELGYRVDEITGRTVGIDYSSENKTIKNLSKRNRNQIVDSFNNGQLDVLVINRSGATGISLHSSERFLDRRPRHLIILQTELNIDTFVQSLGRVHRTGQVCLPIYTLLMSDIPAEKRPIAVLMRKMASLNANTQAARTSSLSLNDTVDWMNPYGETILLNLLQEHPEWLERLVLPPDILDRYSPEVVLKKVTNRLSILDTDSQASFYNVFEAAFLEFIEQEKSLGRNILEAEFVDLKALPKQRCLILPKTSNSPFGKEVYIDICEVDSLNRSLNKIELLNYIRTKNGLSNVNRTDITSEDLSEIKDLFYNRIMEKIEPYKELYNRNVEKLLSSIENLQSKKSEIHSKVTTLNEEIRKLEKDIKENKIVGEELDAIKRDLKAKKQELRKLISSENTIFKNIGSLSNRLNKINLDYEKFKEIIGNYPVGQLVIMKNNVGTFQYGVITEHTIPVQNSELFSLSSFKISVMTVNSSKPVQVAYSRINSTTSYGLELVASERTLFGEEIIDLYDQRSQLRRIEVPIVRGNLVKAFARFPEGTIINYSDSNGRIEQGIRLHVKDQDSLMNYIKERPVPLVTSELAIDFLEKSYHKRIASGDEGIIIKDTSRNNDNYDIIFDKKSYEQYKFISNYTSGDFYQSKVEDKTVYRASFSSEVLPKILEEIYNDRILYAYSDLDIARKVTGLPEPVFEPVLDMSITHEHREISTSMAYELLEKLRSWYRDAVVVGHPVTYLNQITHLGKQLSLSIEQVESQDQINQIFHEVYKYQQQIELDARLSEKYRTPSRLDFIITYKFIEKIKNLSQKADVLENLSRHIRDLGINQIAETPLANLSVSSRTNNFVNENFNLSFNDYQMISKILNNPTVLRSFSQIIEESYSSQHPFIIYTKDKEIVYSDEYKYRLDKLRELINQNSKDERKNDKRIISELIEQFTSSRSLMQPRRNTNRNTNTLSR